MMAADRSIVTTTIYHYQELSVHSKFERVIGQLQIRSSLSDNAASEGGGGGGEGGGGGGWRTHIRSSA
jgi:uncharacterized membrane protein